MSPPLSKASLTGEKGVAVTRVPAWREALVGQQAPHILGHSAAGQLSHMPLVEGRAGEHIGCPSGQGWQIVRLGGQLPLGHGHIELYGPDMFWRSRKFNGHVDGGALSGSNFEWQVR